MAGLRERQVVSVRLVASQINGDALHGPRVWEISHHAAHVDTETVRNTCPAHFLHALVKVFLNHFKFIILLQKVKHKNLCNFTQNNTQNKA